MRTTILIGLILFISQAEARVFSFKDAGLAAYLRGHWGFSSVNKDPFANSSGVDTSVGDQSDFQYGGEFGVAMGLGSAFALRLGAEVTQHGPVSEAVGTGPTDAERFKLESSVFIFTPMVTVEYIYTAGPSTRYYFAVGAGLADVTVDNRYTMTDLGTSDLGVSSFNEKMSAQGTSYHFLTGLETSFVDNTTLSLDIGYRYLPINELKYKGDVNNIVSPTGVSKGDTVFNADGSKRTLDLSGAYVGLTFRFYLHFL